MKTGWKILSFGGLGRVFNGNSISEAGKKAHFEGIDDGVPYIGTKDVSFDHKVAYESGVKIPDDRRDDFKLAPANTVLVCAEGGSAGRKIAHTDREIYFGNKLFAICPSPPISSRLIFYYCLSDDFTKQFKGSMAGLIGGVSINKFKELSVPVPPLDEQKRIVRKLDEAFAGLANAKENANKNLQNARALFESYLESVLRSKKWKWRTLGDCCDDVEYGSSAKSKADGGVPVLRMGNIQDGRLDWENLVYTDDKAEIKKYLLKHNDVLFNRTNSPELVGKTAIYKSEMPAIFAGYLIRIHRKEDLLDGDFLTYFLNSQIAFDYGKTVVISSVNQANINGTKLKSYPLPAPSLSEQKAIVAKLNELSEETQRLARIYEQKLEALESLKKSILHEAFSGNL